MAQRAQAARLAGQPERLPFCEWESLSHVSREQACGQPVRRPCAVAASHKVPGRWPVHAISSKLADREEVDEYKFEVYILTCAPSSHSAGDGPHHGQSRRAV